ncbi:LysM peptidoglycan-binding domain-containing protein [Streptomyces sp. CRN 30]|uniref:LysM peptidoglycan-binding domain-containing protein n=1 Tax=Streptomyces sp. CRN 30 TaxID=3075613 RepID=UPI002A7FB1FD|nr:LysM peptidoglycan-binding domain-containing protein [Streptomyces sp. CRN 30]
MPARGKHRRPRTSPLARGVLAVAGTGAAALALPLMGATSASAAQPAQVRTAPQAAAPTYTVLAGDTLTGIADEHAVDGGWRQLYEDNRAVVGDDPQLIRPGLELTVGAAGESGTDTATAVTPASVTTYADNLDGWIREALDVMGQNGIPGTYDGIHRNVMRESSGNPQAINNWDSNAAAGTPSKGLLQVIDPTFAAYHVSGTVYDPYDPVSNIVAACNYAAARYGSIDNVFGPY